MVRSQWGQLWGLQGRGRRGAGQVGLATLVWCGPHSGPASQLGIRLCPNWRSERRLEFLLRTLGVVVRGLPVAWLDIWGEAS